MNGASEHTAPAAPTQGGAAAQVRQPARRSLFLYSPALVAVIIAIADSVRLADPDLWGHVRFGQLALETHHLLLHDTFSYSAAGRLFHDHEWLTDIVTATAYNLLGVFGLKVLKLAATAVTILMLALGEAETGAPEFLQFVVLLGVGVTLSPYLQFRPQSATFALFSVVLLMLTRDTFRRAGRLWVLIPLLALWANLHGGFIMGIAALGIYCAVAGGQDLAAGRGIARGARLAALTAAAALATLLTPYGLGNWYAILHALRNPYTRIAVADWQPLLVLIARALHHTGIGAAMFEALVLVLMGGLALSWAAAREMDDLPLVAIAAVMSAAAITAQRNVPIAAIAIAVPLTRHAWRAALRYGWSSADDGAPRPAPRAPLFNQLILVVLTVAVLGGTGFFSARLRTTAPYPSGAVAFMQSHDLHGNVLNQFLWGDYLIWHIEPWSHVFIDGRYDTVYPEEVLRQFMLFNFDQPGGAEILARWPHDFVLISPKSSAARIMRASPDWKLIYRDPGALLYARAGSPAAKIAGEPVVGSPPPSTFP
jgi:hypothetical protein